MSYKIDECNSLGWPMWHLKKLIWGIKTHYNSSLALMNQGNQVGEKHKYYFDHRCLCEKYPQGNN